jgi:DNA-binding transcriptional regulator YbjK
MASTKPHRPRGTARREALLDATLTLIGEFGADAVTHRRVAERAGLPLASTTYWFDSKEQLLTEALAHAADQDTERLRRAAEGALSAAAAPTPATIISVLVGAPGDGGPGGDRGALMATYALMLEAARRPALQGLSGRCWRASAPVGRSTTRGCSSRRATA